MNKMISYLSMFPLVLASGSTFAADTEHIRHEIEVFLSSGIGSMVSIILLVLFLLWLLLPLAVFGLKTRIKQLSSETRETNRMLAEVVAANKLIATARDPGELVARVNETNNILADIRDTLTVLNEEEIPVDDGELRSRAAPEEKASAYYDEIKYEP